MTIVRSTTFPLQYSNEGSSNKGTDEIDRQFTTINRYTMLLYSPIISYSSEMIEDAVDRIYQLDSYKRLPNYWSAMLRRLITQVTTSSATSNSAVKLRICQRLRPYICAYLSAKSAPGSAAAALATTYSSVDIELLHKFMMLPIVLQLEPVSGKKALFIKEHLFFYIFCFFSFVLTSLKPDFIFFFLLFWS